NVDIANIANNHVLDHGEKGILNSIENWEKIGIPYVGAYKSFEDQETLRIINKNGLRVCFLSYTKGLGGKKVPKGKEYLVNQHGVTRFAGHKDVAGDRKSTRLNSSHVSISYAVFCMKIKKEDIFNLS